jgi:hypothetical protein
MFKKNRTIWGIAALVSSYLSLFIAVVFAGENKRVSLKMLLMSITQLICGLALIDDEYELGDKVKSKSTAAVGAVKAKSAAAAGAVKEKSQAVAAKVKSKLHTPVMDADEELFDEGDIYDIEEAICDDLGADEE